MSLKVCLVGFKGYWAKFLERNLKATDNVLITAYVDRDAELLHMFPMTAPSLRDALDDNRFDAVVIATPPSTHYELAKEAILAKKHVLIEKPMTTCSKQAHDLNRLARENNVKIGVDHTFLFSPHIRTIKKLMKKGKIGRILRIVSNRNNLGKFQDSGVVWDLMPHDIAMTNWLLDGKPKIRGVEFYRHHHGVVDTAQVSMMYGEVSYSLQMSWLYPKKVRSTVIIGTEGMIEYDMLSDKPLKIYDKRAEKWDAAWVHSFNWVSEFHGEEKEPLKTLIEEFRDYCILDHEFISTGGLGAEVVECIEETIKAEDHDSVC